MMAQTVTADVFSTRIAAAVSEETRNGLHEWHSGEAYLPSHWKLQSFGSIILPDDQRVFGRIRARVNLNAGETQLSLVAGRP
jgi:hypothetical protein